MRVCDDHPEREGCTCRLCLKFADTEPPMCVECCKAFKVFVRDSAAEKRKRIRIMRARRCSYFDAVCLDNAEFAAWAKSSPLILERYIEWITLDDPAEACRRFRVRA